MLGGGLICHYSSREVVMLAIDRLQIASTDDTPAQTVILAICHVWHDPDLLIGGLILPLHYAN